MGIIRARSTVRGFILFVGLVLNTGAFAQNTGKSSMVVKAGSVVSFDYTLTDDDGKVIDSSKGKQPMSYTQGKGEIIPGLEKELTGLVVGAVKRCRLNPKKPTDRSIPRRFKKFPKKSCRPKRSRSAPC